MLFASQNNLSDRPWPNSSSELCSLDQPSHSFQAYAVSVDSMNTCGEARFLSQ